MSTPQPMPWTQRAGRLAAVLLFGVLVLGAPLLMAAVLSDQREAEASLAEAEERLARIEGRSQRGIEPGAALADLAPGAAFLPGDKLSVAAADFQKRVGGIVSEAGGTVLSSQLERGETRGPTTALALGLECEVRQSGLQKLLYGLESGRPFIFVDSLDIRVRQEANEADDPRLRVALRLAATWRSLEP